MSRSPLDLVLVGLSHHTAPVSVREQIAVGETRLDGALGDLRGLPSVAESFIVSTCNRVEVYAATADGRETSRAIRNYLSVSDRAIDAHLYEHHGVDAVRHLFRVCSSLDSMVVGEPQILGQVKSAYATAEAAGTVGGLLSRSCRRAFAVAKRVRTETQVGRAAVSMSFAAVELATKILGSLEGKVVLLIGAGKMSALAARHLLSSGASRVAVVNRSPERAQALAAEIGGTAHPWSSLRDRLAEADVVVCSTAATAPVITMELALAARKARKHRPLFLIDLAVPRDVEPKVNDLDGIFVYDVDDINKVILENQRARQDEAARAEAIVGEEAKAFLATVRSEATPIVRQLRLRGEAIARAELEKTLARVGAELGKDQQRAIEAMSRAIVNKLLHEPTTRIREAGEQENGELLAAAVALFGLEEDQPPVAELRVIDPARAATSSDGEEHGAPARELRIVDPGQAAEGMESTEAGSLDARRRAGAAEP